jgi:DNA primase
VAGRIPQNFIDDLLARVDVVDVVDSRVKLKKAGKNYSACCPFHNENTPSFTVSREKQFYYCFGCGASGTALKFVMEYDGLGFPDAVEKLAETVGLTVPKETNPEAIRREQEQNPLYERLQESADFFSRMLRSHAQRDKAVHYLKGRGLSGKAAKFFGIGYAPPGWDNLRTELGTDPARIKQLVSNGMLIEKDDGRTYDRFRDRIMFPIRDIRGRVIAFGGRVLGDEKPKYLNSPETPVFQKNRELYGLYEARKIRQKLVRLIIVEGYMDVVALAEHGIHYAVATLGTATSEHHLVRLFKLVPEVIFCFDGDAAGRGAAARAMETVLPALKDGLQARFLFLPDGEDPDSLVRQEGKTAFEDRLNRAQHLPEFLFEHLKQQVDFDSMDGKARLDQLAVPMIARIPTGTLRDLMLAELEKIIGVTSRAWEKQQQNPPSLTDNQSAQTPSHSQSAQTHKAQPTPASLPSPSQPTQPFPPEPYEEWSPLPGGYDPNEPTNIPPQAPALDEQDTDNLSTDLYVEKAIRSLVKAPGLASDLKIPTLEAETDEQRLLIELLKKLIEAPQSGSIGLLMQWIGSPYHPMLTELANSEDDELSPTASIVQEALNRMRIKQLALELDQLKALNQDVEARRQMTSEQKQRLVSLQKEIKEATSGRASIYRRKPQ